MAKPAVIVDSGSANLNSIARALEKVSVYSVISDDPATIATAGGVVFPGVGAFGHAVALLKRKKLIGVLLDSINKGKPFLGICLGLQLLFSSSEEGATPAIATAGLNVIPGQVKRFPVGLPVPHVGWNMAQPGRSHPLFEGLELGAYFYYTHSYFVEPENPAHILALSDYGSPFTTAVARDRLMGVQFHPEKSGPAGLRLLNNFGKIIADPSIL